MTTPYMNHPASSKSSRKESASDDWMQVLDNFLDNHDPQQQHAEHQQHVASSPAVATAAAAASSLSATAQPMPALDSSAMLRVEDDKILDDQSHPTEDADKVQKRSERKRNREKQRRSDVNSQFSSLTEILKRVEGYDLDSDVSDDEDENEHKKRKIGATAGMNIAPSNRVDLIARTIAVMERLHQVNRSLRQNVKGLRKTLSKLKLGTSKNNGDCQNPGVVFGAPGGMMGQGNFGGMMMMMPGGMPPQMGMNSQSMQQQQGADGQQQHPMMMVMPMMMPNQMGTQNFMPGNAMNMVNAYMPQATMMQSTSIQGQQQQQHVPQVSQGTVHALNQQVPNQAALPSSQPVTMQNSTAMAINAPNPAPAPTNGNGNPIMSMNSMNGMSMNHGATSEAVPMAVYNPITNAWNLPGGQASQTQQGTSQTQSNHHQASSRGGGHGRESNGDSSTSSYGGNLAECA